MKDNNDEEDKIFAPKIHPILSQSMVSDSVLQQLELLDTYSQNDKYSSLGEFIISKV